MGGLFGGDDDYGDECYGANKSIEYGQYE